LALQFNAGNIFANINQLVDRHHLGRAQVYGSCDQLIAMHDLVDAMNAIIYPHKTAGLFAITPDHDLVLASIFGLDHFACYGCRSFFTPAIPGPIGAVNIMITGDKCHHTAFSPVFLTEHF